MNKKWRYLHCVMRVRTTLALACGQNNFAHAHSVRGSAVDAARRTRAVSKVKRLGRSPSERPPVIENCNQKQSLGNISNPNVLHRTFSIIVIRKTSVRTLSIKTISTFVTSLTLFRGKFYWLTSLDATARLYAQPGKQETVS